MFPTPTTLCEHPLSSHRNDVAQEWSAGLYWPGTLAHLPVLHDGVQASPVPTMTGKRAAAAPTETAAALAAAVAAAAALGEAASVGLTLALARVAEAVGT